MKKFSKLLALLLALAMVVCLTACNKDEDDGDKSSKETTAAPQQGEVTPAPSAPAATDPTPSTPVATDPTPSAPAAQNGDEEALLGTWTYRADISPVFTTMLTPMVGDASLLPNAPLYADVTYVFEANNVVTTTLKIDDASFTTYMNGLNEAMVEITYLAAEASGMSRTDFDAAVQQEYNMTTAEYVAAMMEESMSTSLETMNTSETGYYMVDAENKTIYFGDVTTGTAEEGMVYSLSGNTMTITEALTENGSANADMAAMGMPLPWVFTKQ